jgi:hypothetical protein
MLGAGEPTHRTSEQITDTHLPGIYRVSYEAKDSPFNGKQLPMVINTEWVTTDVLAYACESGYQVTIHEAYQFDEKHRTLEPLATALWQAREVLHPTRGDPTKYPHQLCRTNAYHTMKRIALPALGRFANQHTKPYRPDFWSLVVGRARATELRKLKHLHEQGFTPVLIYSDALSFLSADPHPETAVPHLLDRADKLGGYKHSYTIQMTDEHVHLWHVSSPSKLSTLLKNKASCLETSPEVIV